VDFARRYLYECTSCMVVVAARYYTIIQEVHSYKYLRALESSQVKRNVRP